MSAPKGKARRSYAPRTRTKPTTGQFIPPAQGPVDPEEERAKMYEALMTRFRRRKRGTPVEPETGERALRKAIVRAKRVEARERAFANGKRRG